MRRLYVHNLADNEHALLRRTVVTQLRARAQLTVEHRVVQCALHVFSHTYRMLMNGVEEPTLVTWTLKEENNGTRVTIRHSGWTAAHKAPEKVSAGWTEILGLLKADLETGTLPLKTKIMYAMMSMFMFMLPKTTTKEFVDQQGW